MQPFDDAAGFVTEEGGGVIRSGNVFADFAACRVGGDHACYAADFLTVGYGESPEADEFACV